jgi:peroxiredoxin/uncharacterized protein YciI
VKHFILVGEHLAPWEEIAHLEAKHHQFLQKGYEAGHFLFSGPQVPPHGGFLVARAESREALDQLLANEPFVKARKMRFVRVTEFHPAQNVPELDSWFQKTAPKEKAVTLPEKLAAFRANFEGTLRTVYLVGIVDMMNRAKNELIASGAAGRALKNGDRAPEFALEDVEGQEVSSRELLAKGPLVVTFYRGFWCPYCNMDLQALQESLPAIEERGAQLVAISPQTTANGRKAQRQNKVTFPILSDPANVVAARFGLRFKLPDYLTKLYLDGFKVDLSHINGEPSWTLPMPARYVIDTDGVIAYAEVSPDHTYRPDPAELLPVILGMDRGVEHKVGDQVKRP